MINTIYIASAVGILLSAYTLYLEYKISKNENYKAVCDLSNRMSCTRTVHSSYGKTLGISNGWWGLLYYLIICGLVLYGRADFILCATVFGVAYSARLAYILYFKLKNFCIVCNAIYVVNILLLVFAWRNY